MNEIQLDSKIFNSRCSKLYKKVGIPLILILGKGSDLQDYNLNSALFHYLLGYEFPETILLIQESPIAITSPKKAIILQQIEGLKIVIKNKDDSNIDSILDMFSGTYATIDKSNIKGDLPTKLFSRIPTTDVTNEILTLLSVKEQGELDFLVKSGLVSNYLLQKGIDLIRDNDFSKDTLETFMDDRIRGIDNSLIEYSFDPEFSMTHLRLGIRYRGYCTEISRSFMEDLREQYEIQKYALSLIKPGTNSTSIILQIREYAKSKGYVHSIRLYTVGLVQYELDFDFNFVLENKMCFCLNIDNTFSNTFILNDIPTFVTKKDTAEDYSSTKMRFRNKSNDMQLIAKIKEHQKELLDSLIEEKIAFYKSNGVEKIVEKIGTKEISIYSKDSLVPRSDKIHLDWDNFYILVPILSYSVPFHISTIKNVAIITSTEEPRLRVNFKDSKEIKENIDLNKEYDSKIKFITMRCSNVEELVSQINEMKKEFNKPTINLPLQPVLKEKFKKYALSDVYMRTDNKSANKKTLGNLELHENGFKYNDINILFSNIKNIFFQAGDIENRTILHFNLKEPILFVKPTFNVQFFKKFNVSYHDTSKREGEDMELLREKEEEDELNRINAEFNAFSDRIESETNLKVQIPEKGFLGVHSREAVPFYLTNDCLISINELPFFVLNFDDVEIVSFERITFITKTFDCVFIFHDRSRHPITVGSIETTKIAFIKEMLDSHNILFMENKVNINWNTLIQTIMEDPLGFYENGAWAELLREAEESESGSEEEDSDESSIVSSSDNDEEEDDTTSYDEEEEVVEAETESTEDDSYLASDSEIDDEYNDDETVSESSEERPKKRRK